MGWTTYPAKATFARFAQDWDRLNAQLYGRHPYFDSRFVGPLLKHFANGRELLCIYHDAEVVSGALILEPKGVGRWSSFRPSQAQITGVLLKDGKHLEALFPALPGFAWLIELLAIDPRYSPDLTSLSLPQNTRGGALTIGIDADIAFADYWKRRPKNLRSNLRRYIHRVEAEACSLQLYVLTRRSDMGAAVTRYGKLETTGWKAAAGTAVSADNAQGAFYAELMSLFARSGQAKVYELQLGNQVAASRLVLVNDHMKIILKTAYNEELKRFAPGRLLLYQMVGERKHNPRARTIEFYTNATHEQAEWATFDCHIQNIELFRGAFMSTAFNVLRLCKRRLTRLPYQVDTRESIPPEFNVLSYGTLAELATSNLDLTEFKTADRIETSLSWFGLLQQNVFSDDLGVRYYVVTENGHPTTILPVRQVTKGRSRSVESLANYYSSLYVPLRTKTSSPLALQKALAAAMHSDPDTNTMRFAPMDPDSHDYKQLMSSLRTLGWIPFSYYCFGNWFLRVKGNWNDYLRERSANLRSNVKRRCKVFADEGGTLELATGGASIEDAISAFQAVYASSWKSPEPYPDFIPSLIRHLASNGMLRLGLARLNGQAIAAQLWIVSGTRASIYKVAYDEAFASYAPGTVLTSFLMQSVIERDHIEEVDFLIGDDKYKQLWMSDRRERWGIIAYNPRTVVGLASALKEVAGRLFRKVLKPNRKARKAPRQAKPARPMATGTA